MGLFGGDKGPGENRRFQMREQMMSIGDDYWIEDESGKRAYRVDGKAMRLRDTFVLEDAAGQQVAKIQEKRFTLRDKMVIERAGGDATVQKKLLGIRDHFKIEIENGGDLEAHGKSGPRLQDRATRRGCGPGLEEVVPCARELRDRDRPRRGRLPHAGHRRVPRRDVPRLGA